MKTYKKFPYVSGTMYQSPDNQCFPESTDNMEYRTMLEEVAGGQAEVITQTIPAPLTPFPFQAFVQSIAKELNDDASTSSPDYGNLLSKTITSYGGELEITANFSVSVSTNSTDAKFRLTIDNDPKGGAIISPPAASRGGTGSISIRVTLAAGEHTIRLQWLATAGTVYCRPVTVPGEYATLRIVEATPV